MQTLLELAGIIDSSHGPKVSDDIQLTYLVSDLSKLIGPLAVPTFVVSDVAPSSAVLRSYMEIRPPPDSAIVIPWFRNDDAAVRMFWGINQTTQITGNLATVPIDVSMTGQTSRVIFEEGTGANAGQPIRIPAAGVWGGDSEPAIVLTPGNILTWVSNVTNDNLEVSVSWFEVPLAAQTTAT